MAGGDILPRHQATAAYQILCGNKRKRSDDTDLDGDDNNPYTQSPQSNGQIRLALIKPRGVYTLKSFCENRPTTLARQAF